MGRFDSRVPVESALWTRLSFFDDAYNSNMKHLRRTLLVVALAGCVGAWLWTLWLERSRREEPYALLEDRLYVGEAAAEPPPGTKAVVNLCGRKDLFRVDAGLWEPILE